MEPRGGGGGDLAQDARFPAQTKMCNLVKSPGKIAFVMETVVMRAAEPAGAGGRWEAAEGLHSQGRTIGAAPAQEKALKEKRCKAETAEGAWRQKQMPHTKSTQDCQDGN